MSGFIKYWHWPSKSCIRTIRDTKEIQPLTIDLNRSFNKMVVGGYLEKLHVYDVETEQIIRTLENKFLLRFVFLIILSKTFFFIKLFNFKWPWFCYYWTFESHLLCKI